MLKKEDRKLILKYILIWGICSALIFISYIPGRKGLISKDDGFAGYYPNMAIIGRWIINCFHGNFSLYDFTISFGDDVWTTLSWGGLGDILLMPFCLVPDSLLDLSYTASIVFRIFLAGLFFLFSGRKDTSDYAKIAGALIYSYCSYTFLYSFRFLTFATPMVWVPVIVAGMRKMLDTKCLFSKRLYFSVLFLALCGFYYLYMTILYCFVFLVVDIIVKAVITKDVRDAIIRALRIVGTASLAMLSASVLLIPLVLHFLQSPRTSSIHFMADGLWGFGNYMMELDRNVFLAMNRQMVVNGVQYDSFKLPIIQMISIICLIYVIRHHRKVNRYRLLICSILCVFGIYSDFVALVMNTFSYTYERFYLFIFFGIAYMTSEILPVLKDNWDGIDTIYSVLIVALNVFNIFRTRCELNALPMIGIFLACSAIMLVVLHRKGSARFLAYTSIILTTMFGYLFSAPFEKAGNGFVGEPYWLMHGALDTILETPLNTAKVSDEDFARYDLSGKSVNAATLVNRPTTYGYYSICNGNIMPVLREYAVSTGLQGSFIYEGLDERQILESLFSVSAFNNGTVEDEVTYNEYYLPLGIGFTNYVTKDKVANLSPIEKQAISAKALILDEDSSQLVDGNGALGNCNNDIIDVLKDDGMVIEEIPCKTTFNGDITLSGNMLQTTPGSSVTVDFSDLLDNEKILDSPLCEVYLVISDFYSEEKEFVSVDDKVLLIRPKSEEVYLQSFDRYVNITDIAKTGSVEFSFGKGRSLNYSGVKILVMSMPQYGKYIDQLSDSSMSNVKIGNSSVNGKVDLAQDTLMMYSIPYSTGWKAYIDGQKADILKADYGLSAVLVPQGNHEITLKYFTPGLIVGMIVSLVSIAITIFVFERSKRNL